MSDPHSISSVILRAFLPVLLIVVLLSACTSPGYHFHIAPEGDDNNPGTIEKPLATLQGAQKTIYKLKKTGPIKDTVHIILHRGTWHLDQPFVLKFIDSGTGQYPIVFEAEKNAHPIISGGKEIPNITEREDGIWESDPGMIPASGISDLYVNGRRATPARTPNRDEGYLYMKNVREKVLADSGGRFPEKAIQYIYLKNSDKSALKKIKPEEIDKLTLHAFFKWDNMIRHIDSIDFNKGILTSEGQGLKPWNPFTAGTRFYLAGYQAALDQPGEWIATSEGRVLYFPLPGEVLEHTQLTIPVQQKILTIQGLPESNTFVQNIIFKGITFSFANYPIPGEGFEPAQAASTVDAAITVDGGKNIRFENCTISHTGQHGLWFRHGCTDSHVTNCHIYDLGAGGVRIGETVIWDDTASFTGNIRLDNNIIQSGGFNYPSAVGVWIGQSGNNSIIHNDIGDFRYTGVSVGWVWGYAPSPAKNNKILYNHIHHIGWALLSDMAGVYTLGISDGTEVSHNVVHDIHAYSYGGWGLYPDEGSTHIRMENNLVYNTKTGGFHQHYGRENMIRNNIFAFAKLYQLQCTRVEEHLSFTFDHNIVMFDKGVLLDGAWKKIHINMDSNLYWNSKTAAFDFAGLSFRKWQELGRDLHSIIEDPHFADPQRHDFHFAGTRAIEKTGFKLFDYSTAGLEGSKEWKEKAKLPKEVIRAFDEAVRENKKK